MSEENPTHKQNHTQRQNQKNFIFHVFDGVLFMGGLALTSTEVVLSVLVYRLGGSEIAIGSVFGLTEMGIAVPQLLSAPFIERMRRKKAYVLTCGVLQRLPWLVLGVILYFMTLSTDGRYVPVILALIFSAFLISGIGAPGWSDFVASTVPLNWRGRLFALRQGFTGILGVLGGFVVSYFIDNYPFPRNFSYLFFLCFFIWMLSLLSLCFVRETARVSHEPRPLKKYFLKQIPGILKRDVNFRWFLVLKVMMLMSLLAFNFYPVYGITRYDLTPATAGLFTSLYMGGQMGSALVIGYLTDRYGHRINISIFSVFIILQNLIAIFSPSVWIYCLIFPLMGANRIIQIITFISMPMEYAEARIRPTYFAMSNSLVAPFYLSGTLGGWLVPRMGYDGIFILAAVFAGLSLLTVLFFIREPRHHLTTEEVLEEAPGPAAQLP